MVRPKILAFKWHATFMAIDWEGLERAFEIAMKHGDAGIFNPPIDRPGTGVMGAISSSKIRRFATRPDPSSGLTEVVLEVTYGKGEESLGLTDQVEQAIRWVEDANRLVANARRGPAAQIMD